MRKHLPVTRTHTYHLENHLFKIAIYVKYFPPQASYVYRWVLSFDHSIQTSPMTFDSAYEYCLGGRGGYQMKRPKKAKIDPIFPLFSSFFLSLVINLTLSYCRQQLWHIGSMCGLNHPSIYMYNNNIYAYVFAVLATIWHNDLTILMCYREDYCC